MGTLGGWKPITCPDCDRLSAWHHTHDNQAD